MANENGSTQIGDKDLGAMVERARGQIEGVAEGARRRVDDLDRRLGDAVRENPLLVLGVAVGVGYFIGRIFSRVR